MWRRRSTCCEIHMILPADHLIAVLCVRCSTSRALLRFRTYTFPRVEIRLSIHATRTTKKDLAQYGGVCSLLKSGPARSSPES